MRDSAWYFFFLFLAAVGTGAKASCVFLFVIYLQLWKFQSDDELNRLLFSISKAVALEQMTFFFLFHIKVTYFSNKNKVDLCVLVMPSACFYYFRLHFFGSTGFFQRELMKYSHMYDPRSCFISFLIEQSNAIGLPKFELSFLWRNK